MHKLLFFSDKIKSLTNITVLKLLDYQYRLQMETSVGTRFTDARS